MTGKGWTAPECDGDTAYTVGQGRSLKALNIAVSGVNGTASAAFVHNPDSTNGQGHYNGKPWSNAKDGFDNYFGSSKAGAPDMLGFTINVDNGGRGFVSRSTRRTGAGRTWPATSRARESTTSSAAPSTTASGSKPSSSPCDKAVGARPLGRLRWPPGQPGLPRRLLT